MTEQTYRGGCEVFTKTELKSVGRFRCVLNAATSETAGTLLDVDQPTTLKLRRGRAEFLMRLDDGRELNFRIRRPAGKGLEFVLVEAAPDHTDDLPDTDDTDDEPDQVPE